VGGIIGWLTSSHETTVSSPLQLPSSLSSTVGVVGAHNATKIAASLRS
jgi:hypothetical protein